MARRTKVLASEGAAAGSAPETSPVGETPSASTPVRRTRRRRAVDHAAQTQLLIGSLLRSRGSAGATQAQVQQVVLWARGVHAEAAELVTLTKRVRLRRAEGLPERIAASDLNKALLEGVVSGRLLLDVSQDGEILFREADASPS